MFSPHVHMGTMCMPGAKRTKMGCQISDPLKLGLQTVVSHPVGAGTWSWSFCKNSRCFLTTKPSLQHPFYRDLFFYSFKHIILIISLILLHFYIICFDHSRYTPSTPPRSTHTFLTYSNLYPIFFLNYWVLFVPSSGCGVIYYIMGQLQGPRPERETLPLSQQSPVAHSSSARSRACVSFSLPAGAFSGLSLPRSHAWCHNCYEFLWASDLLGSGNGSIDHLWLFLYIFPLFHQGPAPRLFIILLGGHSMRLQVT